MWKRETMHCTNQELGVKCDRVDHIPAQILHHSSRYLDKGVIRIACTTLRAYAFVKIVPSAKDGKYHTLSKTNKDDALDYRNMSPHSHTASSPARIPQALFPRTRNTSFQTLTIMSQTHWPQPPRQIELN
jgi:hypothetical protein